MEPARDLELERLAYLWHQASLTYWQKKRLVFMARFYALKNQVLMTVRKLVLKTP